MMGASNPHPHGQIWSTERDARTSRPSEARTQATYLCGARPAHAARLPGRGRGGSAGREGRIVCANEHWVALVPFWAVWPFETLVLPRRAVASLPELSGDERGRAGRHPQAPDHALRQPVRGVVPVQHGLAPAADRRRGVPGLAAARALLPAAAALGDGPQVHGRVRDAGRAAARHSGGGRGQRGFASNPRCIIVQTNDRSSGTSRAARCRRPIELIAEFERRYGRPADLVGAGAGPGQHDRRAYGL